MCVGVWFFIVFFVLFCVCVDGISCVCGRFFFFSLSLSLSLSLLSLSLSLSLCVCVCVLTLQKSLAGQYMYSIVLHVHVGFCGVYLIDITEIIFLPINLVLHMHIQFS